MNEELEFETTVPTLSVENIEPEDDNIEIISKGNPYSLTMYLDKNVDEKYLSRFIKQVEKVVRGNTEYKLWLTHMREDRDILATDAFLHNLDSSLVEIQLHHYPINLYNICETITKAFLAEDKKVSTMVIADQVIIEHFQNRIGLVPLSVTMHEIAHKSDLKLVRSQIVGNWESFVKKYQAYISDYDYGIIKEITERDALKKVSDVIGLLEYETT